MLSNRQRLRLTGRLTPWLGEARLMRTRLAALFVLLCMVNGCNLKSAPLPAPTDCDWLLRAFFVVGHGWHTGLVIKRRDFVERLPALADDFPSGEYLEIGWGDERFYQAPTVTLALALQAILLPTSAVVHVVSVPQAPRVYFSRSTVIEVMVPQAGYEQLLDFVGHSFTRTGNGHLAKLGPSLYGQGWFYRAEGTFHAFNTCNTWVAQAIVRTGFPFSRATAITANDVFAGLSNSPPQACYKAR